MNNTFNIKRFGNLLTKDFQENWKRYAVQFLAMFGIMALVLVWNSINNYDRYQRHLERSIQDTSGVMYHFGPYSSETLSENLLINISVMFLVFGIIIAATMMEPMRGKTKRISFLTLPASNFEKIFSRWLIVTVGYIIAFFIALWAVDALRVAICSIKYPAIDDIQFLDFGKLVRPDPDVCGNYVFSEKIYFTFALSIYFLMQSLFVLGSTFWEKSTFVKTFAAIIIIVLLFLLVCYYAIKISYNEVDDFGNVMVYLFKEPTDLLIILNPLLFFFTLVNWVIAFFRFRELEIIKRL